VSAASRGGGQTIDRCAIGQYNGRSIGLSWERLVMRRIFFILVLTHLFTAIDLREAESTQPVPHDGNCHVAPDTHWTKQEKFVWQRVCAGQTADFNNEPDFGGARNWREPSGLPQSRILRSSFIETILLKDKFRQALTRLGVRIFGARFVDSLELESAELVHPLWLEDCLFERGVNLTRLKSTHDISFDRSKLTDKLDVHGAQVSGSLFIQKATFQGLLLQYAKVGGNVQIIGTKVAKNSNMIAIQVEGSLLMHTEAEFAEVDLRDARIGRDLDMRRSEMTGKLSMYGLRVGKNLFLGDEARFTEVDLTNAYIGGDLSLNNAKVTSSLNMTAIQVDADLEMRNNAEFWSIDLTDARVAHDLDLRNVHVLDDLNAVSLQVGLDMLLSDGAFNGSIDLRRAQIKGNLDLTNSEFQQEVDLTGAQIGGRLELVYDGSAPNWSKDSKLILQDAKADVIPGLSDAWPAKLDVDGFIYRSAGEAKDFRQWFTKTDHYSPQSYTQLSTVVQIQGNTELATEIRFAGRDRERDELTRWPPWIWLTILRGTIGYGYYPQVALIWVAFFVAIGVLALRASEQSWRNGLRAWSDKIVFSIDMLLPIIKLREKDYQIDLKGPLAYYFYIHKIMGYVLASFLIAGLSGLTK